MSKYYLLPLLLMVLLPAHAKAEPLQISLAEVEQVFNESGTGDGRLQTLLEERLQAAYDALDPSWGTGEPIYEFTGQNILLEDSCGLTSIVERLQGEITLQNGSGAVFALVTLAEPVSMNLTLNAHLISTGRVEQARGFHVFGSCNRYAEYGFDFDADGDMVLRLDAAITPRIEYVDQGIKYTPTLSVQTNIEQVAYSINVDDKLFASLVEEKIDDAIRPFLDQDAAAQLSDQLEQQFQQSLIDSWGAEYVVIQLPELEQQQIEELVSRFEQGSLKDDEYVKNHLAELYYVLLSGADNSWDNLLGNRAVCELGSYLMADMQSEPLYRQDGAECRVVDDAERPAAGNYYADADCQQTVQYKPTSLGEYCAEIADPELGGDSPQPAGVSPVWTQSPATSLDIGVDSISGNHTPYTTRAVYKQVEGERGRCALEMRIHKQSISDVDLKPLLMLHGGSWERRRNGLVGMESQISHYTEQGFIVFTPSYRLTGEVEGSPACNGVTGEQIVADIDDAFSWVMEHGAEYGSTTGSIAVFGQSAGGYLALRLAVQQPEQIKRMLLLYPATDFGDFLDRWRAGQLGEKPDGLEALQSFIGMPVNEVQTTDPVIVANTVPVMIARQPDRFPPMFVIHGSGDNLVPISQSVRLCNALSGDPEQGPAGAVDTSIVESRSQTFACDQRGSQLHTITAGEHMLDGCLFSVLCPAGGPESQAAVRDSLRAGRVWLDDE